MGGADDLFSPDPAIRLAAARAVRGRARRRLERPVPGWPTSSPGARNAWLLFVTTKPPDWRDPLIPWPEVQLTLGAPHPGFLYPDPMGFWAEVRRWAVLLLQRRQPAWDASEALSMTTLVHQGGDEAHVELAVATCRPRLTVFLDEAAWRAAAPNAAVEARAVPDPHRPGQSYVGWWGTTADGGVVGKAPQHPTMHRLYRPEDLTAWLRHAPRPR